MALSLPLTMSCSLRTSSFPPPRNAGSAQSRHLLHFLARYHPRVDLPDSLRRLEHGDRAA